MIVNNLSFYLYLFVIYLISVNIAGRIERDYIELKEEGVLTN